MATKKSSTDLDFVRTYYEHQYDRIQNNVAHRLAISNYVLSISALAFTFGYQNVSQLTLINGVGLPLIIMIANIFAISNITYTAEFIDVHRSRAHEVLQRYAAELSNIDKTHNFRIGLLNRKRKIEKGIHQLLIIVALIPFGIFLYQTILK